MEFYKNVDIEQLQPMSSYRIVESNQRTSCTFAPWERATEGDRASIAGHGVMATRNSLLVTRLTYQIEGDLLLTCDLLQTLLQKIDSSEEAVHDEAVRQVVEMINEALKVFSRSTSLSATGLYRAFAKGKSWLIIEGSTLDKHLLFALHRMVKKTGGVKGLFVHVDPGRSGPASHFSISKIKMVNYEVVEVLAPLFVREPYPLSVETKEHHFVVEFGILAGAFVTATDATWPDWKAATATAAATQAQLRSLVPIGELSSFMIKTTVAGPLVIAGPSERVKEQSEEEKDKERKKRQAKRRAIERRRENAEQRWKDQLAKLAAEDEEDDKVKGDGEVNDDEEDELAP
ncbi:hypothetical protein FFLO_00531 [Filobasidium floriforme]|uniref:Uncharacterized protein n=1 Tax=Filobasidium floriforme TaxID=5210 RepID=A0A8K0JRB0_9TREE|nr:hypothetical protein FFLO_00531 [Filobasidium floriforme]